MKREDIPFAVSRLIGNRPVRWAKSVGDYDGRERTLQVFNADVSDRRALDEAIDSCRSLFELAADGPFVIIFYSTSQSAERYADFIAWWQPFEEDDLERESLLRKLLAEPVVRGTIYEGDHPAYHVYLDDGTARSLYACVIHTADEGHCPNFWSQPVQETWPNLDVHEAVRRWCERCFPDLKMPEFVLEPWSENE